MYALNENWKESLIFQSGWNWIWWSLSKFEDSFCFYFLLNEDWNLEAVLLKTQKWWQIIIGAIKIHK
jgi:hypothetical protein